MENDPSKKESKGKRILKKALRRNSKSSNNSQNSPLDLSIGSRSKSFENKRMSVEINDSTPLPTPDGTSEKAEHSRVASKLKIDDKPATKSPRSDPDSPASELRLKKTVDINEEHNTVYDAAATASPKDKHSPRLDKNDPEVDKRSLKRVRLEKLPFESMTKRHNVYYYYFPEIRRGKRGGHERRQHGRVRHRRRRQGPQQGQKEKEQMRRLPQESRTHRVRVSLRRSVLRRAPVQRQARVLVRLPGARRAGDPPQQPRRRVAEDTQDMSLPPLPPPAPRPSPPPPPPPVGTASVFVI